MPRIAGVDIPANRPLKVSLTYLYGIGNSSARRILDSCGIENDIKAKNLTEEQLSRIAHEIDKSYVIEGQKKRQVAQNISRLKEIRCYRGLRHIKGLPVRGQRTKTNARTRKGPRRTVAVKRSVKRKK